MYTQVEDNPEGAILRAAPLSNIEPLLHMLGFDPVPVFRAVGLDPLDFRNAEYRIPYTAGSHLLYQCAKTTGNDQFGLLLGQFFILPQLGIPGMLATSASNVGTALHDIVRHFDLHEQGGVVTLSTFPRYTAMGYAITMLEADARVADQVYDLCISCCCALMRSFCGPHWTPSRVELSRGAPGDPQVYRDYFRAPVVFNGFRNAIVFSNKWLDHPIQTADASNHNDFSRNAEALHHAMPNNVSLAVRAALHGRLSHASCNANSIAELLGLQERTLHRRLQSEGTSFRKLLDQTRKISSFNYLKSTSLSINSIANALGYGSTDAFDHAFKRWYGQSPKQWRDSGLHTH